MQNDIWTSNCAPNPSVFYTFDFDMTSRHNGLHFFGMSTSKSGPTLVCFVHFDLETCFALQQRPLFHSYLNFQKRSETVSFLHVWLGNVLRATTACTFSTSQLPKVVRTWCVLYIWLGNVLPATTACICSSLIWPDASAPAALARLLLTLRSHKPLEKHSELRLSYLFAHLHLLSSHSFSSLISLFFSSSLTVPTSAFPSVHIVGSLTSKLPSIRSISYIMLYTPIITYLIIPFRKKRRKGPSGFPSRGSCQADSPSDRRRTAGRPVRWWPVAASLRSRRTRRPAGAPSPGVPVGGFTTNKWEEVPSRSK